MSMRPSVRSFVVIAAVALAGCASAEREGASHETEIRETVTQPHPATKTSETETQTMTGNGAGDGTGDSNDPPKDGDFRISPVRDIELLRTEALGTEPPAEEGSFRESELVELTDLDKSIRLDVRYATDKNFMGSRMYEEGRAFLQRPAAEALVRVNQQLKSRGLGLIIYDGYRPWYVTKMFWEATPVHQRTFVANPMSGSRHNRGCAVDLGLYDRSTGMVLPMPSGYDEFSERAYSDYPGGTPEQNNNRKILREAMESEGFIVNPTEWWHFDYEDWRDYRIQNRRFAELD